MGSPDLLEVSGLVKSYDPTGSAPPVLRGTSFVLRRGEVTSLMGTSGAGKSTLLAILAGLMLPDRGWVSIDGKRITDLDETGRAALRSQDIGVVLQSDNLIPFLTAVENVELAITLAGRDDADGRARRLLVELGLVTRADDYPRRLSGGEAQRVALAVALANDPQLLLADEVTGELDTASAELVADSILAASADRGLTVLLITHSLALAERANCRLRMVEGEVRAS